MTLIPDEKNNRTGTRTAVVLGILAIALTGVGTALAGGPPGQVDGKSVKVGSEPGNRLIKNSVTGAEVKESTLGKVAGALKAVSAESAAEASRADTVTRATSASTVGGLTPAALTANCPAGTAASSGYCIETGAARPALGFVAAQAACGQRTLPTAAMLENFRVGAGLTGAELTGDLFTPSSPYTVDMATGLINTTPIATGAPFRCVTVPTN